jgi:hypothetical protein
MPHLLTLSKTGCSSAGKRAATSSRAVTPPPCQLQDTVSILRDCSHAKYAGTAAFFAWQPNRLHVQLQNA